ncbi:hypothetical protein SUDANB91_02450 [Streptomyces sp. SudanB91_2054]
MRKTSVIGELVDCAIGVHTRVSVLGRDDFCLVTIESDPVFVILAEDTSVLVTLEPLLQAQRVEIHLQAVCRRHRCLPVIAV